LKTTTDPNVDAIIIHAPRVSTRPLPDSPLHASHKVGLEGNAVTSDGAGNVSMLVERFF